MVVLVFIGLFSSMRRFSSHHQPKKRSWFSFRRLLVFILVLGILGGFIFGVRQIKTVYSINLDQTPCVSEDQIESFLRQQKVEFYSINEAALTKKIQQQFNCIQKSQISYQFPTKVNVNLTGRKAVIVARVIEKILPSPTPLDLGLTDATASTQAALPTVTPSPQVLVTYGSSYLIDDTGTVFSQDSREDLPHIDLVIAKLALGDSIGKEKIKNLLDILNFFNSQQIQVVSTEMDEDKLTLKTDQQIVFSLADSLERQRASLQLIWKQAKIDSKSIEMVDLRFDKPVVRYAPTKK